MLRSMDTFNGIIQMRKKVVAGHAEILKHWKDYISTYPEIEEQCLKDASKYDFDREIRPVMLRALTSDFNKVETAHNNFVKLMSDINDDFQRVFSIHNDICMCFYMGLCNGAGWATEIDSKQTVLIGSEKVAELDWHDEESMAALMCHELCHIAHSVLRNESLDKEFDTQRDKSMWQLYVEGFAQRYEQILYRDGFFHQDKNGWLEWCQDNHDEICREYLHRMKNNMSTQCFFGDWVNFKGRGDVGYYLGCEFIKDISNGCSTKELANIGMHELESLLTNYLEKF